VNIRYLCAGLYCDLGRVFLGTSNILAPSACARCSTEPRSFGAGHVSHIEKPDEFEAAVADFLAVRLR
jgi:hypothetical protein